MTATVVMRKVQESQETQEVENLFILTSTSKFFEGIGKKQVYGIEVQSILKERVDDISSDKNLVISLLQKLAEEQCSPLHLKDVIEDFVIDQSI
jgi:N-acetylglutamate synthase-like GNAT family acetyltransferase